ncbi:hypothetical protein DEU56DRAFT_962935 [Suillus clintonianus]|uniref:uncharacterized protein n=1 Tax=Suillus clintonianus TaxID=1904413 RepID=UPI001B87765E|nr:uncharacterized protein DEU56DRAFT_962935 [Suillus clintonianus]KAG2125014.1 hypothetical protein DEU56DRAFT_962935 [Suillus clintonianus]
MGFKQYRVKDPYGLNNRGQRSAWTVVGLICSSPKAFACGHSHIGPQMHGLQVCSIDGYVLQGTSPHSASLTPPHTNTTGYTDIAGYANMSPFGKVHPSPLSEAALGLSSASKMILDQVDRDEAVSMCQLYIRLFRDEELLEETRDEHRLGNR